jgi:hypothetical protein
VPSQDPVDAPLATVQAENNAAEISVELAIEIQPRNLVFHRIFTEGSERAPRTWFQREKINVELIARRLIELTHKDGSLPNEIGVRLGRTVLRGKRRSAPR